MDCNSCRDRQENEKAALMAIFGHQVKEVPQSSRSWRPLECKLTLGPQGSSSPRAANEPRVELHIICSESYPEETPQIQLLNWKKISNVQITELSDQLNAEANRLKGEVMIFELAQFVEKFLLQVNQPDYSSFYEEMITKHKEKEEKELKEKNASEQKRREEILQQIQTKQQAVKRALRRRSISKKSVSSDEELEEATAKKNLEIKDNIAEPAAHRDIKSQAESEDYTPWNVSAKGQSRFHNEFEHINWLGKGAFGDVLKVRNKLDDGYYAIKKIELNPSNKQLNKKITREVKLLSRLNHENVVRYYNSWIEYATCESETDEPLEEKGTELSFEQKNMNKITVEIRPRIDDSPEWSDKPDDSDSESSLCDWIDFRSSANSRLEQHSETTEGTTTTKSRKFIFYLYIQMELCEKSTLRLAIDKCLYQDEERVWRLLREIVEGLCHIHQQGIIHRDLKPVNIFIGLDDHVKIGDFGLATSCILKPAVCRESVVLEQTDKSALIVSMSHHTKDVSHTGQVGTTYYVAPELNNSTSSTNYNHKVDIYSLGIIFFEMCHPPFNTSMERYKILTDLRLPSVVFPTEFPFSTISDQYKLIRWMLNHDVKERPNSQQLLQSDHIPPPKLEEAEVKEMVRRTLSNPQSRDYKYLVASCFHQSMQPALDATFNISSKRSCYYTFALEYVTQKVKTVFQQHGAISFLPPLLTPANNPLPKSAVCLMTRLGGVVVAPFDLRSSFSRYLVQNPHINNLKRYAIDKVYRERPAGIHPREIYECAFDIVTHNLGNLMPEIELISVIWEILNEFPAILSRNCVVYLNHSSIISSMLNFCGLDKTKHKTTIQNIFEAMTLHCTKQEFENNIRSLPLSGHAIGILLNWIDIEGPLSKVYAQLNELITSDHLMLTCKTALNQLERIIQNCETLGLTCPVLIKLRVVSSAQNYSGLILQVVCDQKFKGKTFDNVILTGGRYDKMLSELKQDFPFTDDKRHNQCVCGFSLSIDKFITLLGGQEKITVIDVLVCSLGLIQTTLDRTHLIKDLWRSGIKTFFVNTVQTLEEIQVFCQDQHIPVIVLLKETEPTFARVKSMTNSKDRYVEKKVPCSELIDYLLKITKKSNENVTQIKSDSRLSLSDGPNIVIIPIDKLNRIEKKRYESQISNSISVVLQRFSNKVRVEVIALSLEAEVLKFFSNCLDLNTGDHDFNSFIKRYPRYKKYIKKAIDHVENVRRSYSIIALILFSLPDNIFKIVL